MERYLFNKFIDFCIGYKTEIYTWTDRQGNEYVEQLPVFVMEIPWNCSREHMIKKWKSCCNINDTYGSVILFYTKLDFENQESLVKWMSENHKYYN